MTLRFLDLFCCQGGAGFGYEQSGMECAAAVDLDTDPRHPSVLKNHYSRKQPGASDITHRMDWKDAVRSARAGEFGLIDFVHASPPCQRYSPNTKPSSKNSHPDLVGPVRDELSAWGIPYVIENVPEAPLNEPAVLSGCMFGLTVWWEPSKHKVEELEDGTARWEVIAGTKYVYSRDIRGGLTYEEIMNEGPVNFHLERRRGFEANFPIDTPSRDAKTHSLPSMSVVGGTPTGFWNQWYAVVLPTEVKSQLMRTEWMSGYGVAESIPPAYTEHIGLQLQKYLGGNR